MNNNDFYGNLNQIRKFYLKEDFESAVRIADKMDFKRLKEWKYIAMLINLYEAVGRLEDVRYFCILAYNKNLGGKKLIYKLAKVSIRLEDIDEAEDLYEEFCEIASRDSKRYELLYELKLVQGAKKAELIKILEDYMSRDLDEKYAYTLAEMYAQTRQNEKCIDFCDRIVERFEDGEVVEKALKLKNFLMNPDSAKAQETQTASQPVENATVDLPMAAERPVGQNTIGLNVEQIMAEAGDSDVMSAEGATQTLQFEEIMMTQAFAPQNVPIQDTQELMIQNLYDTQDIPVEDIEQTQAVPVQNFMQEQDEDEQDMSATEEESEVDEDVNNVGVDASMGDDLAATQVIPNLKELEEQIPAIESESDVAMYGEASNGQLEMPEEVMNLGQTIRVDTEAVNQAIMQVAQEMEVSIAKEASTQDIESTVAIVEAALANETKAAQFDARMDMPEYSEEHVEPAPSKEKVLRPFQPEIDRVYEIPMAVKRYFTKYNYITGLEAQLGEYFESTIYEDKMGTSGIGNIIISGNRSSDKTTLAINIVKALNTLYSENVRKIARTTAENINQRGIERSLGKLMGAALIIESAGSIDRQRILEMVSVMEGETQELLIILEDSESEINELLKNNPELIEKFNHRITYKQFTVNELVEMCKRYADKCHYTIDEKALLQLYLRIDNIHSNSDGVSLEDVRDVVDEAMKNAEKRAAKKIFGSTKKKKVGDKDYTILVEADFKE